MYFEDEETKTKITSIWQKVLDISGLVAYITMADTKYWPQNRKLESHNTQLFCLASVP